MHKWNVLKTIFKIYIKVDIKTPPTCFGAVTPSSGSALFELAEVTVVNNQLKYIGVVNSVVQQTNINKDLIIYAATPPN
jgi:hypothetical protein